MSLLHFSDGMWFLNHDVRPVAFYGYETHVRGRIFETGWKTGDALDALRKQLSEMFTAAKIKAELDNKIVFVVEYNTQLWCLGFYDMHFSLGTSFRKTF